MLVRNLVAILIPNTVGKSEQIRVSSFQKVRGARNTGKINYPALGLKYPAVMSISRDKQTVFISLGLLHTQAHMLTNT